MKRSLKFIIILAFVVALWGCSGNSAKADFIVDENIEDLEDDGYKDVGGVLYAKIEQGDNEPVVQFNCYENAPEVAVYAMSQFMSEMDYECSFLIVWNGEEYDTLDWDKAETEEEVVEMFPLEWQDLAEDMLEGIGIDSMVSKSTADNIDEDVAEIVESYQESIEESEINVISSKEYSIEDDTFSFGFSENDGEYSLILLCDIEDKADASSVYVILNALMDSDDEDLSEFMDIFSYTIVVGDGTMIYRSSEYLFLMSEDGDNISADDYFSVDWMMSDEYHESDYGEQVADFLIDFIENE